MHLLWCKKDFQRAQHQLSATFQRDQVQDYKQSRQRAEAGTEDRIQATDLVHIQLKRSGREPPVAFAKNAEMITRSG